ncbi:hypothetical protein AY599_25085 [Leptolyngbya valderiana BDU 20041]|nr:hypothetical protein AY599_25085 [Leptolyngbya valderiana BDU 20041]
MDRSPRELSTASRDGRGNSYDAFIQLDFVARDRAEGSTTRSVTEDDRQLGDRSGDRRPVLHPHKATL